MSVAENACDTSHNDNIGIVALLGQPIREHFVALLVACALYVQKSVREAANQVAEKFG